MTEVSSGGRAASTRAERGKQFWTVENLTSAPFLLVVATVLLCAFGLVMVFSASSIEAVEAGGHAWNEFVHQAAYMVLGVAACLVVRHFGASLWVEKAFWVLWIATLLLLGAVLAMGDESHGATRWLYLGPVSLQPSEFAKITIIMAAARLLAEWECGHIKRPLFFWAWVVVLVLLPMGLILLQKDLGTLLILGATMFLMMILAGVPLRFLLALAAVAVAAVGVLIATSGYRLARFTIFLDPYSDYYGDGWQLIHGLYAVASGGFFGVGLGNSRQKYSYLPEAENDFIFAIIGEELGFLGALLVIGLFVLFGVSGMRIAYQAREHNRVSSLMASGLTVLIMVQALLNIGGVLQILPLSGRPLPFISAGGSSILANMIIVGLLLGVARDTRRAELDERGNARRSQRPELSVVEGSTRRTRTRTERSRVPCERGAAPSRRPASPGERERSADGYRNEKGRP